MKLGRFPIVALGAVSCVVYTVGFELDAEMPATRLFPALYYPLFAAYLGAAWWVWRHPGSTLVPVLVFAAAFRLLAAQDPPSLSSDVYRYAWDGRVGRAGINPYRHPPGHEALAMLADDEIHPRINRPAERTVYPPGAQVIFLMLPYHIGAVRGFMILADLMTIVLLWLLLVRLRIDPGRVVIYAWSPLVVYEVGNNGHLEAVMVLLLVAAVLAYRLGHHSRVGLLLSGAVALKLYPVLAGVALGREHPMRVAAIGTGILALLYGLYGWSVGSDVLGFLPQYLGSAEDHNIGLRRGLEWALSGVLESPRPVAFGLCVAGLLGGTYLIVRRRAPLERQLLQLVGLYLLTLPTAFHPWYALWLVPWLCIHPRASWLWLTGTLPLSYLKYGAPGGVMPDWVVPMELLPTAALLAWEARSR